MALTKTRTRNQTTLNKLAFNLAEVNGELSFLAALRPARRERKATVAARQTELQRLRDALFVAIRRFDGDLDPNRVGESFEWLRPFGRKPTPKTLRRYFDARLSVDESVSAHGQVQEPADEDFGGRA